MDFVIECYNLAVIEEILDNSIPHFSSTFLQTGYNNTIDSGNNEHGSNEQNNIVFQFICNMVTKPGYANQWAHLSLFYMDKIE